MKAPTTHVAHPRWDAFKRSFTESNYITDFWNWLMTLMSKAAELVLFGSVLYSGYQLLPGINHAPAQINAVIFVMQQGALDIGGMGLLKRAGLPNESFPVRIGVTLVVLMILNVVLASVKQALPMIPSVVFLVVETLLLIVRAVMAVLFGHAIHALREEYAESTITVKEAHELQQGLQELANVVSRFHQQLAHVESNVQQRLNESATVLASSLQVELAQVQTHVQTTLQAHQDQLATLPQLQAQLQQMESTSREQFHHMQAILEERAVRSVSESEKLNERPSLHVVPVAQQGSRTTKPEERRRSPERALSEEKFDARVFVFACLEENREWKLADIEQLALAAGHTLSQPSISRYRKQFYARRESTTIQSASSFANAENTSESAMMKELALGE